MCVCVCVYIYIYYFMILLSYLTINVIIIIILAILLLFDSNLSSVHLLRVFLVRVLESNFPGDPLYNYTDMTIPTP